MVPFGKTSNRAAVVSKPPIIQTSLVLRTMPA
nr:TPA_asm: m17.4 sORF [Murid betaherpesvirus 1]DBA07726.1 TPA_asm: m17.4 sORF [Murid betaherpesvirus 1]